MEFPVTGQIIGTVLFFVGIWVLSYCSKVEKQDKDNMRKIRYRQPRYQDRNVKISDARTYEVRGTVLSLGGYTLAMAGILMFIMTTQWVAA